MRGSKLKDLTKEQLEKYRSEGLSFKKIADKYKVAETSVIKKAKKFGIDTKRDIDKNKYFNIYAFDTLETEEQAYWLGFLFADGYIRSDKHYRIELELKYSDIGHIKKFKDFLKDTRDDSIIKERNRVSFGTNVKVAKYTVYNKHIVNTVISYGCFSGKSLILKFPDKSIFKKKEIIIDFIRGYIDGDGCLCKNGERLCIEVLGTYDVVSNIHKIFPEFPNIYEKGNQFELSCTGSKADLVAHKLYGNATVYLDRKYNKYATLCKLYTGEKSGNIGESCDANTEITSEITQGPEEL